MFCGGRGYEIIIWGAAVIVSLSMASGISYQRKHGRVFQILKYNVHLLPSMISYLP